MILNALVFVNTAVIDAMRGLVPKPSRRRQMDGHEPEWWNRILALGDESQEGRLVILERARAGAPVIKMVMEVIPG